MSAIGTSVTLVTVTAIVVAHDGARWLDDTLTAVLGQSRPPDRVVGVDNGSRDGCGRLLAARLGEGGVLTLPRSTGFGDAVEEVLDRLPASQGAEVQEWIWLLHDDCAPDARALEALLWAAAQDPRAAVLGPKLRDWLDRKLLLEVGVTVDRTGRRDTGLEAREYDQGQHEGVHDVLSVSTAGMLIRRDVWDDLGGLDPALPLFRDDLDLCWRARNAGYRVLNVTHAVAWHAEAAARRRRRIAVSDHHPRRLDRRNALFVVLANMPFRALLWTLPRNVLGSIFRTVLLVLAKQPGSALDEVRALGGVLGHPIRLAKARRARAYGRRRHYPQVKQLLTPPGAVFRRFADMVQGYLSGSGPVESAGRHHAAADDRPSEEELLLTDAGLMQRTFGNPGVLLFLGLLAVTVAAEWRLIGGSGLGGGALVPVSGGASDLWRLYTESFHSGGLGTDAWAPPYVAVVAALATLAFGKIWLAVSVLLLGCVPLAGVSAYLATRSIIPSTGGRVWLAAAYALLPVATGAVAAGRLGTAVVLVLLPAYASLATVLPAGEGRRSRRAAWGLGLLLAIGTAFVPLVYPLTAVIGLLGATAFGAARRGVAVSVGIALGVPLVLLFPWLGRFAADPGQILLEAGLHRPELTDPALPAQALLTLSPGGPGMPPLWAVAGLLAAALAALLMRRQRMAVAVGWGVALYGVLAAILVSRATVAPAAGGPPAAAWPGVPLAFAATGMLVVAALTAHRLAEFRAAGGIRRALAYALAAVACSAPLICAGHWAATGLAGPLRGDAPVTPLAVAGGTPGERTLVLRGSATGGLTYTVLRSRGPLVGEADLPVPGPAKARLATAAAGLAAGRGGTDAGVLATYGVRFVVVRAPEGGRVDPEVAGALDSQPALGRLSLSDTVGVWRLTAPPALAWITGPGGGRTPVPAVTQPGGGFVVTVPAGGAGRTLVLAEPVADGRRAIGAQVTPATVDGWAQGFTLGQALKAPATVRITHEDPLHRVWLWAQAVLVVAALVLASPGRRPEEIVPDYGDQAAGQARPRRSRRKEMAGR
ncbi:glycosyltransferase family 2 protein [Spongiactinospora gelatinilytica]|uniref:glycosyltransferase family 2 protein n=1 Tax=Spongiactinospora gelatinilytica TaxID=2666298 RepID=UPI0018F4E357|nr:glycosyltransferase family 2 protein [Spongiactinospora gelatinilytica]